MSKLNGKKWVGSRGEGACGGDAKGAEPPFAARRALKTLNFVKKQPNLTLFFLRFREISRKQPLKKANFPLFSAVFHRK